MLLKSHLTKAGVSKSEHTKSWLRQLQADAKQVLDGNEGEIWIMNPTKNPITCIIEHHPQLKDARIRELKRVDHWGH